MKITVKATSLLVCFLSSSALLAPCGLAQGWTDKYPKPVNHGSNPYQVVKGWLQPFAESGFVWGSHPGIWVESNDRIFIIQRGELEIPQPKPADFTNFYGSSGELNALRPKSERVMRNVIFVVNGQGKLVESWTQWDHLFTDTPGPHKVAMNPHDPDKKLWVVNDAHHQIHAFSNDGKELVMSLGTWDEVGEDATHLGRPQDIAFLSDGSIVVADGLINSRVAKYDAKGNFIMAWGSKGTENGQFDAVHAVAVDKQDSIYVADRSNDRIQVFDKNGKHLNTWNELNFPNHIVITAGKESEDKTTNTEYVWVADNQPVRLVKFNTAGERLYSWDLQGRGDGEFDELHQFAFDSEGNLYAADNILGRSLKFIPKL
jgi:hypothetical protein